MKRIIVSFLLILLFVTGYSQNKADTLQRKFSGRTAGYSRSVKVTINGVTTIYVSGLTGEGKTFNEQTLNAFRLLMAELYTSNANLNQIVKMNTYIVNLTPEYVDTFRTIRKNFFGVKELSTEDDGMPASTIVGISALAEKGKLIEIEAVVVLKEAKK